MQEEVAERRVRMPDCKLIERVNDLCNYSDIISRMTGASCAGVCCVTLPMKRGSLRAAANRQACRTQSRRNAAVNASMRPADECAAPNLHPQKAPQGGVRGGPPESA